ncbi:MAG: DUF4345 family protein [Rhizobiales bacterium]|nr:DUF4345 family protein [Hyphomicrobiales bacterium]
MDLSFPWPTTSGEWGAWASAVVTLAVGLVLLFAPRIAFRVLRLQTREDKPHAIAAARGTMAGFYLGVGACAALLAQPLLYMTLGFCWLFTVFGRLISMLSDAGNRPSNWIALVIEIVLAALPLGFAFGFLP